VKRHRNRSPSPRSGNRDNASQATRSLTHSQAATISSP
jgi:hypothetical protein